MAKARFKPAKLYDAGGDISKRWYVEWVGFDCRVQRVKRIKQSVPAHYSSSQRYQYARQTIEIVNRIGTSQNGEFFKQAAEEKPGALAQVLDIRECLDKALAIKKPRVAERSYRDFTYISNKFYAFLVERQQANLRMADFTKMKAIRFLDEYQREHKLMNKSRNNLMSLLRALFTPLVQDGTIAINPFAGIESLKESKGDANPPFTPHQRDMLLNMYSKQFPELRDVASFIYYLLMRPIEVMRLQVKHLDFERRLVRLPAVLSKTDEVRHPKMSDVFYDYLVQRGIDKLPGNWYVFGDELKPAATVTRSEDMRKRTMEHMHIAALRRLKGKVTFESKQKMYSWKSTGAMDLFRAGAKLKYIQLQCGHSSVAMTEVYLKNLGAFDDDYSKEINEKQAKL